MFSVFASHVVGREFVTEAGHTKDHRKIIQFASRLVTRAV